MLIAENIAPSAFRQRIRETIRLVAPPPHLTVSEWADRYRYVSAEVSSHPGQWRTDRVPYLREIMDCVNDPTVETIVIKKAARMAITEFINNAIGYHIDYDPCPILYVQQSLDEGKIYADSILQPLIDETPALSAKVFEPRARDKTSRRLYRQFPGGRLRITGANSPKGFRMVAYRIVIGDDIDGFELVVGKEGNPIHLMRKRAATFHNRKIILASSPTVKDFSLIDEEFNASDQRYRHVPCPHCGGMQILRFGGKDFDFGLKWTGDDPDSVYYLCEHCHEKIYNFQLHEMDRHGQWIAAAPFKGAAGFHINWLYSFNIPWSDTVREWLKAQQSPSALQAVINTVFGETWEDREHDKVKDDVLLKRREQYGAIVPLEAGVLVAGVDVQQSPARIEIEVTAYGKGEESWNMDYRVIPGNTNRDEVWDILDKYLLQPWQHASGKQIYIACAAIDTGYNSKQVYRFIKSRQERYAAPDFIQRIIAVKGSSQMGDPVISQRGMAKNKLRVPVYIIGTDTAKASIYNNLQIDHHGPGYLHFPMERDEEYFKQLTAEKLLTVYDRNGYPRRVWKKRERDRNEALDNRVYSLAALYHLIMNLNLDIGFVVDELAEHHRKHINQILPANNPISQGRRILSRGVIE